MPKPESLQDTHARGDPSRADEGAELDRLRQAHEVLLASHRRILQLIELCPHPFYSVSEDGRLLFANRATAEFLGFPADEVVGRLYAEVRPDAAMAEAELHAVRRTIARGEPVVAYERLMRDGAGRTRVALLHDIPYFDEEYGQHALLGIGTDITDRVAKERIDRELELARLVQRGLLPPPFPSLERFQVAAWHRAAAATGGDYYDWESLSDGRLMVSIADVCGHGIGPALLAADCRAYFRAARAATDSVADVVMRVNRLLADDLQHGAFVTAALAILDSPRRRVELHSAGLAPLLLFDAARCTTATLGADGVPLGIERELRTVETRQIVLGANDLLVLLTDGFFEAVSPDGEAFGVERVARILAAGYRLGPAEIIDEIRMEVFRFVGDQPQRDDLTAVVVKCTG